MVALGFGPQMTCAVMSIGTELTRGEVVNSNATWLSSELTDMGFEVVECIAVDDDRSRIAHALNRLAARTRVVVCTGGLGPTTDDVTTEAVANALGTSVIRDAASLEQIRLRFERFRLHSFRPEFNLLLVRSHIIEVAKPCCRATDETTTFRSTSSIRIITDGSSSTSSSR